MHVEEAAALAPGAVEAVQLLKVPLLLIELFNLMRKEPHQLAPLLHVVGWRQLFKLLLHLCLLLLKLLKLLLVLFPLFLAGFMLLFQFGDGLFGHSLPL